MNEFDAMDEVAVPDQWDDIVERSAIAGRVEPAAAPRRWLAGGAIAAAVLAVTLVAGLVALDRSDDDETVTLDSGPALKAEEASSDLPVLACADGELAAGSIPADATLGGGWLYDLEAISERESTVSWSWRADELEAQVVVPPTQLADLVGERFEEVELGTLVLYGDPDDDGGSAQLFAETGLAEPCQGAEVVVRGGTEVERRAAALEIAEGLQWIRAEEPRATEVNDVASALRFALSGSTGWQVGGFVSGSAYVHEWQVGDDGAFGWLGETDPGGAGAERWTVVLVADELDAFRSLRGAYEGAAPMSSVAFATFGRGHQRGMSIGLDPGRVDLVQQQLAPVPFMVGGGPTPAHANELEEAERRAEEQRRLEEQRRPTD